VNEASVHHCISTAHKTHETTEITSVNSRESQYAAM